MKHNFEGFIFDMDGTMIDNMMVHHRAWKQFLFELGLDLSLEEVRLTIHGKNEEILIRLFGDRFTPAERTLLAAKKEATYREVFEDQIALIPGLQTFLDAALALDIPMAIGTAAPAENVVWGMEKLNLHAYFNHVVHAGMVQKGKPDPEVFDLAAAFIEAETRFCIVFEDSPTGVQTALNAGALAVVLTTTHTAEEFAHFPNVLHFMSDFTQMTPEMAIGLWEKVINDR